MTHKIYQTSGFILKTKNMRESNKLVYIYTERFGLIYATLQSVREMHAKMSFHAQTLSLVELDLVQGRDIWKITGIHENISALSFVETAWYEFFDTLASLLLRLCTGEEAQGELWKEIASLFELQDKGSVDFKVLEIITVVRILYYLGYWEGDDFLISSSGHNQSLYEYVEDHRVVLVGKINQSLQDSQL